MYKKYDKSYGVNNYGIRQQICMYIIFLLFLMNYVEKRKCILYYNYYMYEAARDTETKRATIRVIPRLQVNSLIWMLPRPIHILGASPVYLRTLINNYYV